ncbi:MAG: DUF5335 family protein [Chitinophagaceae bacterium]|nr:DUF5335 family protein [Oligoflexus sp.]
MVTRSLAKEDWKLYFDDFSKHIQSERVELDVMALDIGDQIEEDHVLLNGLSYDPKDDMIYVFTYPLRHFISHPDHIWLVEDNNKLQSIDIETSDGEKHLLRFRDAVRPGVSPHNEPRMNFEDLESIP